MDKIINSTLNTLEKSKVLLQHLTNDQLSDHSVPPYFSSIGSHIRHILDFYKCILNESACEVDLTKRERNLQVEVNCDVALEYLESIRKSLVNINSDETRPIKVIDDLGCGQIKLDYTFGALMSQANSHTIHHYAIINYILEGIGISIQDSRFGFNPTTPVINRRINKV